MISGTKQAWTELFATEGLADFTLVVRVLEKSGAPFLMLPAAPALAVKALELYQAQTKFARSAKWALGLALQAGLPIGLEKREIKFSRRDPFPAFLANLARANAGEFPPLAILAGNPRAEGQRFIVLLFDAQDRPIFVVKAGMGGAARELIRHETAFLRAVPPGVSGPPKLRDSFSSAKLDALALEYVEGDSPRGEDWPRLGALLEGWLNRAKTIRASEIPAWQALEKSRAADPAFRRLAEKLSGAGFHPALAHGDLAPWNIKVSRDTGAWTVLDWERGETIGFPAWDWFHYVIQTAILVENLDAENVLRRVESLMSGDSFQKYARLAGIEDGGKLLAAAYLMHCVDIVRPSEGIETDKALLAMMCARWLSA